MSPAELQWDRRGVSLSPWAGHISCGPESGNSSFSELSHSRAMGWAWVCVLGRAGPAPVLLW